MAPKRAQVRGRDYPNRAKCGSDIQRMLRDDDPNAGNEQRLQRRVIENRRQQQREHGARIRQSFSLSDLGRGDMAWSRWPLFDQTRFQFTSGMADPRGLANDFHQFLDEPCRDLTHHLMYGLRPSLIPITTVAAWPVTDQPPTPPLIDVQVITKNLGKDDHQTLKDVMKTRRLETLDSDERAQQYDPHAPAREFRLMDVISSWGKNEWVISRLCQEMNCSFVLKVDGSELDPEARRPDDRPNHGKSFKSARNGDGTTNYRKDNDRHKPKIQRCDAQGRPEFINYQDVDEHGCPQATTDSVDDEGRPRQPVMTQNPDAYDPQYDRWTERCMARMLKIAEMQWVIGSNHNEPRNDIKQVHQSVEKVYDHEHATFFLKNDG